MVFSPSATNQLSSPLHPYYPTTIDVVGYVANQASSTSLLLAAGALCGAIGILVYKTARWHNCNLLLSEIAIVFWFVICTWRLLSLTTESSLLIKEQREVRIFSLKAISCSIMASSPVCRPSLLNSGRSTHYRIPAI